MDGVGWTEPDAGVAFDAYAVENDAGVVNQSGCPHRTVDDARATGGA